ncbi:hypothetical protein EZS27_007379 [termite gut metagenome]|uniref:PD-(D/E)XK nuclease superfamily protein n=1 Tax=termite gut metagenome TaxID=433724 RepID=A0A5J4SG73_9ZZZZ
MQEQILVNREHILINILNQVRQINKNYNDISSLSGEKFNIFQIIKLTTYEVRVHSAFLAELLNPKGSHGQGSIFLELFTKQLELPELDYSNCNVEVEKFIGSLNEEKTEGGRMDIFISDNKGNCIAIENKIYAGDQENQLVRYKNYCDKVGTKSSTLIYLTLDGKKASDCSAENVKYFPISYQWDIVKWLESCRKESAMLPIVREGITHYINLIKYLTNQSINEAMSDEILKIITSTPENLEASNIIVNNINNAKSNIQWKFWEALRTSIENNGLKVKTIEENKRIATSDKVSSYYRNDKIPCPLGLWVEVYKKDNISVHWGAEIGDEFYVGFIIENESEENIADQEKYAKYRNSVKDLDPCYNNELSNSFWLGRKYTEPILNFRTFNTKEIYKLVDENYLQEIVSDIANDAAEEIKTLQEELKNIDKIPS